MAWDRADLENIVSSKAFLLFLDEKLRKNACNAADKFLSGNRPVKNTQLQAILPVVQANGLSALKDLAEQQRNKNTNERNRKFWEFIHGLVIAEQGSEFSLRSMIKDHPDVRKLLKDEGATSERLEQRRIRRENRDLIDTLVDRVLPVYFEHFTCHYFYTTNRR